MKRRLAGLLVAVMICSALTACSGKEAANVNETAEPAAAESDEAEEPEEAEADSGEKHLKIGVDVPDMSNPLYDILLDGMRSALREGDELVIVDAGLDIAKQITTIEDFVNGGCDAIAMNCFEAEGIIASMEYCKEKGVPVFVYDNASVQPELAETTIVSDNYALGYEGGKILVEYMPEGGKVAMYEYPVSAICVDRANGFKDALEELAPGKFEIVNEQSGDPTVDASMPIMENILQATPDIDVMWAVNSNATIGVHAAIESAKRLDDITIVGVDDSDDIRDMIREGTVLCTVAQDFPGIGRMTIEAIYDYLDGKNLDSEVLVPVTPLTADNVDE